MAGRPGITGTADPPGQDSPTKQVGFGPLFYASAIYSTKAVGITGPAGCGALGLGYIRFRVLGVLCRRFVVLVCNAPEWAYFAAYRVF